MNSHKEHIEQLKALLNLLPVEEQKQASKLLEELNVFCTKREKLITKMSTDKSELVQIKNIVKDMFWGDYPEVSNTENLISRIEKFDRQTLGISFNKLPSNSHMESSLFGFSGNK